jgi:hypothetical protein
LKARDLKAADKTGKSDPFVTVKRGSENCKTSVIDKTLNPIWNEVFIFEGASGTLLFTVYDWDRVGSNDFLGEFSVDLNSVDDSVVKEGWYALTGPPKAKVTGEVHIMLYWSTKTSGVPRLQPKIVAEGYGQLFVEVLGGKDLAAKDKSGTSDVYCRVEFGGLKFKTLTKYKTLEPTWDDAEYYFEVAPSALDLALRVAVFDWDMIGSDDPMGQVELALLTDLPDGKEVVKECELVPQKKETVSGTIKLRATYISAQFAQANYKIADDHYDELVGALMAKDAVLVSALCSVYQSNEVSSTLVSVFEGNGQAHRFLSQLLYREIKRTEQETTLFRTDSMATKSVRNYLKLLATSYLTDTMGPIIDEVIKSPAGYEVDPAKVTPDEDVDENMKKLEATAQRVLDAFVKSVANCPAPVRELMGVIRLLVGKKFPASSTKAVGGFFFLRFSCPAIFSPEGFGLVATPPTKKQRRALTLISKVMQNLSNGVQFGKKEPFMEPMNAFVTKNLPVMTKLLSDIAVDPTSQLHPSSRKMSHADKVQELSVLVRHFDANYEKIGPALAKDARVVATPGALDIAQEQYKAFGQVLGK